MDFKNLKPSVDFKDPTTLCTLGGCVLLLLASFLPQAQVKVPILGTQTGNLMSHYAHQGIFLLILSIGAAAVLILNISKEKVLPGVLGALAAIGLWSIIAVFRDVSDAKKEIKASSVLSGSASASYSIGFFVLILGVIAVAAAIVLNTMNAKKAGPAQAQPMA